MRHPALFGLGLRLDAAVVAQITDTIGDPFDVLLDGPQHVGGAAGAGDREQVGKPGDPEAEIGLRTFAPFSSSARPPVPRMSIFNSAPVIASKPVARTMASTAYSRSRAWKPAGVITSIGSRLTSIKVTFERLYFAQYPVSKRLAAEEFFDESSSATSGLRTISRILLRTDSTARSLAA